VKTVSEFVLAQHLPLSQNAGVDDELRRIVHDRDHTNPALSAYDRAVIQFAAEVAEQPQASDAVFAAAREFLSDREVVELLQLCGCYWTLSRMCTVLQIDLSRMYAQESVAGGFPAEGSHSSASVKDRYFWPGTPPTPTAPPAGRA
jgi:hypothetical protein